MRRAGWVAFGVLVACQWAAVSHAAATRFPTSTRTPIVDTRPTRTPIVDTRPTATAIVDTRPTATAIVDTRPTRTPIPTRTTRPTRTLASAQPTSTPTGDTRATRTASPTRTPRPEQTISGLGALAGSCSISSTKNQDGTYDGLITLRVTNISGVDLTNVVASDLLVDGDPGAVFEVVSGPVPAGGQPRLQTGSSAVFRYTVEVNGRVSLGATALGRMPDGSAATGGPFECGSIGASTPVHPPGTLDLIGTCNLSSTKNQDGTFDGLVTLRVTNVSGVDLTSVRASDLLVDAYDNTQFEVVSGPVPAGGQPRLQDGSSATYRYIVRVNGQAALSANAFATLPDGSSTEGGPFSCGTIGEPPVAPDPDAVTLIGSCTISSTENQDGTFAGLVTLRVTNVSGVDLTTVKATQLEAEGDPAMFEVTSGPAPMGGQPRLQDGSTVIFRYRVRIDGLASLSAGASGTMPGGATTTGGPFECGSIGREKPVRPPGAVDLTGNCWITSTLNDDGTYDGLVTLRVTNVSGVDLTNVVATDLDAQGDPGSIFNVSSGPVPAGGQPRLQDGSSVLFRYRLSVDGRVSLSVEASGTLPDGSTTTGGPFDCGVIGQTAPDPDPDAVNMIGSCNLSTTKNQDGTFDGLVTLRVTNISGVDLNNVAATPLDVDADPDTQFELISGPVPAGGQPRLQDGSTVAYRYRVHVNGYASLSAGAVATLSTGGATTVGPIDCGSIGEPPQPPDPDAVDLIGSCSVSSTQNQDRSWDGLVTLRVTNVSGVDLTNVMATSLSADADPGTEIDVSSGPVPAGGQPRLQDGSTVIFRYRLRINGYATLSAQALATLPGGAVTLAGPFDCGTIGEKAQPPDPDAVDLIGSCSISSTQNQDRSFDGLVTLRVTNTSGVDLTNVAATGLEAAADPGTQFEVSSGPVPTGGQPRLQDGDTVTFRYRVSVKGYATLSARALATRPGGATTLGGPFECGAIGEKAAPPDPDAVDLEGTCGISSTKNQDGTYDGLVTLRVTNTSGVDLTNVAATGLETKGDPGTQFAVSSGPVPAGGQPRLQDGDTVTFRYRVSINGYASVSARALATLPSGKTTLAGPFNCGTIGEKAQAPDPGGVNLEGACGISSTRNEDGTFDGLVTLRVTNVSGVDLTNVAASGLEAATYPGTRFDVTSGPVPAGGQPRLQDGSTVIFRYRVHINGFASLSANALATLPAGTTTLGGPFPCGSIGEKAPVPEPDATNLEGTCQTISTKNQDGTYDGLVTLRVTNISGVDLTNVAATGLLTDTDPGTQLNVSSGPVPAGGQPRLQDGATVTFRYRLSVNGYARLSANALATLPGGATTRGGPFDCGTIGEQAQVPEPGAANLEGICGISSTRNEDGTYDGLVTLRVSNVSGVDLTNVAATGLDADTDPGTRFEVSSGPVPAGGQPRLQSGGTVIFRYRVSINGYASLSASAMAKLPNGATTRAGPFACGTIGERAQVPAPGAANLEGTCGISSTKNQDGTFDGLVTLRVTNTSGVDLTNVAATGLDADTDPGTDFNVSSGPVPAGGQPRLQSGGTVIFRYRVDINGYASLSASAMAKLPNGATTKAGPFACGTIGERQQIPDPAANNLEGLCSITSTRNPDGTYDGLATFRVTNTSGVDLTNVTATALEAVTDPGTEFNVSSGPVPAGGQPRLQDGSTAIFRYRMSVDGRAALSVKAFAKLPNGATTRGGPYPCGTIGAQ